MIGTVLSALVLLLKIGNGILERMDDAKLREAGRTKEVAHAALELLATIERASDVDAAILTGESRDWVRRVKLRAGGDG